MKRAKPMNLVLSSAAEHGSGFVYHDVCPIRDMLDPTFLLPVLNHFRAGDEIKLRHIVKDEGRARVAEIADVIVIYAERDAVHLCLKPGFPMVVPDPTAKGGPKENAPFYVTGQGSAGFAVRDHETKKVVYTTKDQEEADAIAAGNLPLPVAA